MMKRWRILIPVVLMLAAFSTGQARAADRLFAMYSSDPVVAHGKPGTWNSRYTDPGAQVIHNGTFYMFYNGFNGWPASVEVGLATSTDGYKWTLHGDQPVMKTAQVKFAQVAALASSVIVQPDGTWVMYFYTWDSKTGSLLSSKGVIGRATAPDAAGPWTPDAEPVLTPGKSGSWDDLRVDVPSVVLTDKGYVMYYSGSSRKGDQMVGMATSADGIHWTKYNDPATTDGYYAESDPVLLTGKGNDWDSQRVQQPRVVQTADGLVMLYRSVILPRPSTIKLGIATSTDGIHWDKFAQNPVIEPSEVSEAGYWFTGLLYQDDTYFLFIEKPTNDAGTAVFLATHKGALDK
jgi:predicted GH43/DUF377 family glycosyl hydrolase